MPAINNFALTEASAFVFDHKPVDSNDENSTEIKLGEMLKNQTIPFIQICLSLIKFAQ